MTEERYGYDEAVTMYLNESMSEFPEDEPENLMGHRVGKLMVCMPTLRSTARGRMWLCRCSCGKMVLVGYKDLMGKEVTSCGCVAPDVTVQTDSYENLSGRWRGMLHIIEPKSPAKLDEYLCKCECGKVVCRTVEELNTRGIKSCGCLEASTRPGGPDLSGLAHHPLKLAWNAMRQRCRDGIGRDGISHEICPEWEDYLNYYHWAYANGWKPGAVVHRLDMTKPYSPDNCVVGDRESMASHRRGRRTKFEMESESIINRSESIED